LGTVAAGRIVVERRDQWAQIRNSNGDMVVSEVAVPTALRQRQQHRSRSSGDEEFQLRAGERGRQSNHVYATKPGRHQSLLWLRRRRCQVQ
jgi:hypothetical protein